MLHTALMYHKKRQTRMPYRERIRAVRKSMDMIKVVLGERSKEKAVIDEEIASERRQAHALAEVDFAASEVFPPFIPGTARQLPLASWHTFSVFLCGVDGHPPPHTPPAEAIALSFSYQVGERPHARACGCHARSLAHGEPCTRYHCYPLLHSIGTVAAVVRSGNIVRCPAPLVASRHALTEPWPHRHGRACRSPSTVSTTQSRRGRTASLPATPAPTRATCTSGVRPSQKRTSSCPTRSTRCRLRMCACGIGHAVWRLRPPSAGRFTPVAPLHTAPAVPLHTAPAAPLHTACPPHVAAMRHRRGAAGGDTIWGAARRGPCPGDHHALEAAEAPRDDGGHQSAHVGGVSSSRRGGE